MKSHPDSPRPFSLAGLFVLLFAGWFVYALTQPGFRYARQRARHKACQANLRVIQGAVEMYNLDRGIDRKPFMETLDFSILTNPGVPYLKTVPTCPFFGSARSEPAYASVGNLLATDTGALFCWHHGFLEETGSQASPSRVLEQTALAQGLDPLWRENMTLDRSPVFLFDLLHRAEHRRPGTKAALVVFLALAFYLILGWILGRARGLPRANQDPGARSPNP